MTVGVPARRLMGAWGATVLVAGVSYSAPRTGAEDFSTDGESAEPAPQPGVLPFGLEGDWYLLVHYRDDRDEARGPGDSAPLDQAVKREPETSASPAPPLQWDDRVWRFERKGDRLVWTILPSVAFKDTTGRFEMLPGDRRAPTLGAWEPNAAQLQEIAAGLEVHAHGAKSKSLRSSDERGYESVGALHSRSTTMIGYHERWSIDGMPNHPVFTRAAEMGSGRTENVEGRTRYVTTQVRMEGRELRGDFERDGAAHGRFRLLRMGMAQPDGSL